jgi:ribonuclease VapC
MPAEVSSQASTPSVLLDSWPILEWLKGRQPAAEMFRQMIESAVAGELALHMSRMNYGEVVYSLAKDFPPNRVGAAHAAFVQIPIRFHSVDDALVDEAAALKAVNTISYADAFAAALALRMDVPLVTGDREFIALRQVGLRLVWVGA